MTIPRLSWKDLKGVVAFISLDRKASHDFILKKQMLTLIGRKKIS